MTNRFCYICYDSTEGEMICDICDQFYCHECSYSFTLFYQHEGSRCHYCSDQSRKSKLTKDKLRNNKIDYLTTL